MKLRGTTLRYCAVGLITSNEKCAGLLTHKSLIDMQTFISGSVEGKFSPHSVIHTRNAEQLIANYPTRVHLFFCLTN